MARTRLTLQVIKDEILRGLFVNIANILNENYVGWFYDIGDPSAVHFDEGDLTTDETWNDLDLSSILPQYTKAVLLKVLIRDDAASSLIQFRKNGNSNPKNRFYVSTQVANVWMAAQGIVFCDDDRVIEYYATNTTFSDIDINVIGYWK